MNRSIFKEGSTWGGLGLILSGVGSIIAKDYATGIPQILAGIGAVWHK
jgi:hypothetical protein